MKSNNNMTDKLLWRAKKGRSFDPNGDGVFSVLDIDLSREIHD